MRYSNEQMGIDITVLSHENRKLKEKIDELEKEIKEKIDPKSLGIPNINFSLYSDGDEREQTFLEERLKYGFDQSETWCLYLVIARFILPRLKLYKDIVKDYLAKELNDQFHININKSIRAMELIEKADGCSLWSEEEEKEVAEGLHAFADIFLWLWH